MSLFAENWRKIVNSNSGLVALTGVYFISALALCLFRYYSLNSHMYDLGLFDNVLLNFASGKTLYSDLLGKHFLSHHFMPILYVFSIPYFLGLGGPVILIFIQSLLTALSVYFLGVFLHSEFKLSWPQSNLFCFIYACSPSVHNANFYDFHPESALPLLYLLLLIAIRKKSIFLSVVSLLVILSIKEHVGVIIAAVGLSLFLDKTSKKTGIALVLIGICSGMITGILGHVLGYRDDFFCRYQWLGENELEMIQTALTTPLKVLQTALIDNDGLRYLFSLFIPVLFICFLEPQWLLPILPVLVINLFGGFSKNHLLSFYYQIEITIWIILASALAWRNKIIIISGSYRWFYRVFIFLLVFASMGSMFKLSRMIPFSKAYKSEKMTIEALNSGLNLKNWASSNISENDFVSATGSITFPEITHLGGYSLFPNQWKSADYLIIDTERIHWIPQIKSQYSQIISEIEKSNQWIRIPLDKRIVIFKRNN